MNEKERNQLLLSSPWVKSIVLDTIQKEKSFLLKLFYQFAANKYNCLDKWNFFAKFIYLNHLHDIIIIRKCKFFGNIMRHKSPLTILLLQLPSPFPLNCLLSSQITTVPAPFHIIKEFLMTEKYS